MPLFLYIFFAIFLTYSKYLHSITVLYNHNMCNKLVYYQSNNTDCIAENLLEIYIMSLIHLSIAIRWSLFPSPHRLKAQWGDLSCDAEPRIELGPAWQQAGADV